MVEFPRPDGLAAGPAAEPGINPDAEPGSAGVDGPPGHADHEPPSRFERIRSGSAAGVIMTGIALGFREALTVQREEPAIVAQAPGEPPGPPRVVDLHVDLDDPAASVAVVRPWLVAGAGDGHPDAGAGSR